MYKWDFQQEFLTDNVNLSVLLLEQQCHAPRRRAAPHPPSALMTLWQRSTRWDIEFHSEWWAGSPSWHSLTPCEVPEWISALDDPDVTPPTLQSPFVFYVLNLVHCILSCNYIQYNHVSTCILLGIHFVTVIGDNPEPFCIADLFSSSPHWLS